MELSVFLGLNKTKFDISELEIYVVNNPLKNTLRTFIKWWLSNIWPKHFGYLGHWGYLGRVGW